MSKITYNAEILKIIGLFEKITRVQPKDCFFDNNGMLTFVVDELLMGRAIGKSASNVKKIEAMLKRKIKIVGFNPSPVEFARNLIYPAEGVEIEKQDNLIIMKVSDSRTKGFLIGRNQANIKNNLQIMQKYFKTIENIKVI